MFRLETLAVFPYLFVTSSKSHTLPVFGSLESASKSIIHTSLFCDVHIYLSKFFHDWILALCCVHNFSCHVVHVFVSQFRQCFHSEKSNKGLWWLHMLMTSSVRQWTSGERMHRKNTRNLRLLTIAFPQHILEDHLATQL